MLDTAVSLLPQNVSPGLALGLIVLSLVASTITAALSLGGGILMLSVLSLFFPPAIVLPVHGAIQLGSNGSRALVQISHVQWPVVLWMSVGAIFGAALGGHFAAQLPEHLFRLAIGLFILFMIWVPRPDIRGRGPIETIVGGAVIAFLGMIVGVTGPLVLTFIRNIPNRLQLVGTHAMLMTVQNVTKVVVFIAYGFAFGVYLPLLAAMLLSGFIGTAIGSAILVRLPERGFRQAFRFLITLLALDLIRRALMGG